MKANSHMDTGFKWCGSGRGQHHGPDCCPEIQAPKAAPTLGLHEFIVHP